jgi:hypothetical protein
MGEKRAVPERRLPFVKTDLEEIAAYGAVFGACLSLHLEVRRIAGQARVKAKGGWVSLDRISLERVGLANRFARYRAVQRLQALGWLEVRGDAGSKLEYRVPPNWVKAEGRGDRSGDPKEGEKALIELLADPTDATRQTGSTIASPPSMILPDGKGP